jgi:hypothetical protein
MNGPPTCYVFNAIANDKNSHKEVAKLAFFLKKISFFHFDKNIYSAASNL